MAAAFGISGRGVAKNVARRQERRRATRYERQLTDLLPYSSVTRGRADAAEPL
jgi:hypothetical protein